jgi:rubrerythrin
MTKAMTDRPTRPILHLKANAAPAPKEPKSEWRCKPCGSVVEIDATLADTDPVRCPACGAGLGRAGQFRSDPPQVQRLRARRVIT